MLWWVQLSEERQGKPARKAWGYQLPTGGLRLGVGGRWREVGGGQGQWGGGRRNPLIYDQCVHVAAVALAPATHDARLPRNGPRLIKTLRIDPAKGRLNLIQRTSKFFPSCLRKVAAPWAGAGGLMAAARQTQPQRARCRLRRAHPAQANPPRAHNDGLADQGPRRRHARCVHKPRQKSSASAWQECVGLPTHAPSDQAPYQAPYQNTSKTRARGFWRAFGLGGRSTAGGGRPGTRTAPPQAHVSPPTRPEPSLQLVRGRFAGFSKIDPFHSLKVG